VATARKPNAAYLRAIEAHTRREEQGGSKTRSAARLMLDLSAACDRSKTRKSTILSRLDSIAARVRSKLKDAVDLVTDDVASVASDKQSE
jgi:hypothetical protein